MSICSANSNPFDPIKKHRIIQNNFTPIGGSCFQGLVVGEILSKEEADKKFSMWRVQKTYHCENIPMNDIKSKLEKELIFRISEAN